MQIETAKRLHDALGAAMEIQDIVAGSDARTQESLRVRQLAIERLLAIVGEALNRAIQSDAPLIIGMRNRIIHGYDDIRDDVVWDAARNHILGLILQFKSFSMTSHRQLSHGRVGHR